MFLVLKRLPWFHHFKVFPMLDMTSLLIPWRFVCVEKFLFPGTDVCANLSPTSPTIKQLVTTSLSIKDLLEYLKKSMGEQAWRKTTKNSLFDSWSLMQLGCTSLTSRFEDCKTGNSYWAMLVFHGTKIRWCLCVVEAQLSPQFHPDCFLCRWG